MRWAMGPAVERPIQPGGTGPPGGTRRRDGFIPERPQQAEGMRMDPPPSEPVASGTMPAARAAAAPPEDPPAPWAGVKGVAGGANSALVVLPVQANSGRLVLPTTTQPAPRSRATKGLSPVAGGASASTGGPQVGREPTAPGVGV